MTCYMLTKAILTALIAFEAVGCATIGEFWAGTFCAIPKTGIASIAMKTKTHFNRIGIFILSLSSWSPLPRGKIVSFPLKANAK
jgi:hypothetical protein